MAKKSLQQSGQETMVTWTGAVAEEVVRSDQILDEILTYFQNLMMDFHIG